MLEFSTMLQPCVGKAGATQSTHTNSRPRQEEDRVKVHRAYNLHTIICPRSSRPKHPVCNINDREGIVCGHRKYVLIYVLHRKRAKANESEFEKIINRIIFLIPQT